MYILSLALKLNNRDKTSRNLIEKEVNSVLFRCYLPKIFQKKATRYVDISFSFKTR